MVFLRSTYILLLPIGLGLIVLVIPLLGDFHLESALLAALAGCFWGGWKASKNDQVRRNDLTEVFSILLYLYLFGFPLLVYALFTGCFSVHGLGFWLLYPIPSVFFGYSVGRLFRTWSVSFSRILTILTLTIIGIGALLVEFYSFPQVYFFNHVWGGWPGPIYDETVQVTGSLFYFRFLTLLWVLVLWFIPDFQSGKKAIWIVILSLAALLLSYIQLAEAGIISPRSYLQKQLGGFKESKHFKLYFAENYYSDDEINRLALEHEFYLDQIVKQLQVAKPDNNHKIESYLYAHPWQKKKLVGAKFTSYVPVWLEQDQLHIAKQQLDNSLKHELTHVIAKQFGNELFNASWSIGLIEGLAVAVSPDESRISTIDQIVVSEKPVPGAGEMQQALSPLGFYGGRPAVNYTTSGSFVQYLLKAYPVSNFKEAYKRGSISEAYPVSFEELVRGWYRHLDTVKTDSIDERIAQRLFSIPSLFEKACPHILTDFSSQWDKYQYHLAEHDTLNALKNLERAYKLKPENPFIKSEWVYMNLGAGNIEKVQRRAAVKDTTIDLLLLYADAFLMTDNWQKAKSYVNEARKIYDESRDSTLNAAINVREDSLQWRYHLALAYQDSLFSPEKFLQLDYRTQIRMLNKAIEKERFKLVIGYAEKLKEFPTDSMYFDSYIKLIHQLGYLSEFKLAKEWINKVSEIDLRKRYTERLKTEKKWIMFLENDL